MNKMLLVFMLMVCLMLNPCQTQTTSQTTQPAQQIESNEEFSIVGEWVVDSCVVLNENGEEEVVSVAQMLDMGDHINLTEQQINSMRFIFFNNGTFAYIVPESSTRSEGVWGEYTVDGSIIVITSEGRSTILCSIEDHMIIVGRDGYYITYPQIRFKKIEN